MGAGSRGERGLLEVIQQLGQPLGIPQKEPSHHGLKPRGLPIGRRVATTRSAASPVATAPHLLELLRPQQRLQLLQGSGLSLCLHQLHHGAVEIPGAAGAPAVTQPLMQVPDSIPQPGELQGTKVDSTGQHSSVGADWSVLRRQPEARPGRRLWGLRPRRGGQGRCRDRVADAGTPRDAPVSRSGRHGHCPPAGTGSCCRCTAWPAGRGHRDRRSR
jgi:hypothetical protein